MRLLCVHVNFFLLQRNGTHANGYRFISHGMSFVFLIAGVCPGVCPFLENQGKMTVQGYKRLTQ